MSAQPQLSRESRFSGLRVEAGASRIGRVLHVYGSEIVVKISTEDTTGAFAVAENRIPAKSGPPLHRHFEQDEWWHILEGQFLFEVDGDEILAGPGDVVFAPRGSVHTFENIGDSVGRTLVTVVPGGLDLFFKELSDSVPSGVPPDPKLMAPLFAKHGMELLGPPLEERKALRDSAVSASRS